MFEHHEQALLPLPLFILRLLRSLMVGIMGMLISLAIGMLGYHLLEKFSWPDAFVNAAMILSGMGPMNPLTTTAGKIFAGLYALYSGLIFIILLGIILAPIIHRFFHKMHHSNKNSR